jgi:integrase
VIQAFSDGLITKNPYAKMKIGRGEEDGLTRYLTPAEFHRFEKCTIDSEHLAKVRDLFVFQTYTCMSYSDLAAFDYRQCENIDGKMVYRSSRVKTDQPFTIVLLKPALVILQRYGYKLPIISNPKYNEYLKVVAQCAGIDKPVSSHWARHTGATLLLNEGVDLKVVARICGHSSVKITEQIYAKLLDETVVDAVQDIEI